MNSILHVMPSVVQSCTFDGTYKDIIGRARFLASGRAEYTQVFVAGDDPSQLDEPLSRRKPTHVLVEYTYYHNILETLRRRLPDAFIAARAVNIEPLQHFDNHGFFPKRGPVWLLYGMLRLSLSDWAYRRKADVIYPITEWEARVYWSRLPGKSSVRWLPYFPPDFVISELDCPDKQNIIACLPGKADYARNRDTVERFLKFAEVARALAPDFQFIITGDLGNSGIRVPEYVECPGLVEDIAQLLSRVKAVAVLSPLGYGFKTTIADALANRCYALVHPRQVSRGPMSLEPGCIEVDAVTEATVEKTLQRINEPFPRLAFDVSLREQALSVLGTDFGLEDRINSACKA